MPRALRRALNIGGPEIAAGATVQLLVRGMAPSLSVQMLAFRTATHLIHINGAAAQLAPIGANGDNSAARARSYHPERKQS